MATQTKSVGTIAEVDFWGYGTFSWSDLDNMKTSDDTYATVTQAGAGSYPNTPLCTNFGFTIPAGSIIQRIDVKIEGKTDDTRANTQLDWCSLVYGGNPSLFKAMSLFVADYAPDPPLTNVDQVFTINPFASGDGLLWGSPWTVAMVNATSFGCVFDCDIAAAQTVSIDHVSITITYETGTVLDECSNRECDIGFQDLNQAIKAFIGRIDTGYYSGCAGLKIYPALKDCADLTDLVECGTKYTLEQAFKAALKDDGCGGASLRMFVLFQSQQ